MRLLFVSGTTVGGSGRSQRELAGRLVARGHEVSFLVDDDRPARVTRWLYEHLSDLVVRAQGRPGAGLVAWLEQQPGRRIGRLELDGLGHRTSPVPQNALPAVLDELDPDVVVCSSVERLAWQCIHRVCEQRGSHTVLYVRETTSLDHPSGGVTPDLLVANAESLRVALEKRGFACSFIPSVIDTEVTRTTSSRRVALAINPITSRGSDTVWGVAAAAPEISFVVQESWPLQGAEIDEVRSHAARLANVEFRRSAPPGPQLYQDARVLLVPYRVDNRPRVIAEAQANGIPVVAADMPALREAVGNGGITVPVDDVSAWVDALRRVWADEEHYQRLVAGALEYSRRPDIDPDAVAASFEALLAANVDARSEPS